MKPWMWLVPLCVMACSPPPPNLILLIGDDHGYRDFGFTGSPHALTPHLDELAAGGTVFRQGYTTASICRPALLSLLTGLDPLEYGLRLTTLARRLGQAAPPVPRRAIQELATLPRALAARGYASFQAGKHFEGSFAEAGFSEGMVRTGSHEGAGLVRLGSDAVYEFIERERDRPFFVWFAPKLPHTPHTPPASILARYEAASLPARMVPYFASVSWYDDAVGELVNRLEALGLRERTLLVYVVDNGWEAGASGGSHLYQHGGPKGKQSLYEVGFRTPVLFNWPGHVPAGVVRDDLVSTVDLFPTLLAYAGALRPAGAFGQDLRPAIDEGNPVPRDAIVGHMAEIRGDAPGGSGAVGGKTRRGGYFVRTARWHYLGYEERPVELYDVVADPEEEHDLAAQRPNVVRKMRRRSQRWVKALVQRETQAADAKHGRNVLRSGSTDD